MKDTLARYRKAIGGGISGLGIALVAVLQDGAIDGAEWWGLLAAVIAGAGGVAVTPANRERRHRNRR
jgi:hypothetical protein